MNQSTIAKVEHYTHLIGELELFQHRGLHNNGVVTPGKLKYYFEKELNNMFLEELPKLSDDLKLDIMYLIAERAHSDHPLKTHFRPLYSKLRVTLIESIKLKLKKL